MWPNSENIAAAKELQSPIEISVSEHPIHTVGRDSPFEVRGPF